METDLIVREQLNPVELFTDGKIDPLLEEITRKAKEFVPDLSTDKSRKEIASMARKVARSKTLLDDLGKDLVSDWKTKSKKVDEVRKYIRDYLDNLRDEVRLPLTEYEADELRKAEEAQALEEFNQAYDEALHENDLFDRQKEIERKEAELEAKRLEEERKAEAERLEQERIDREKQIKLEAEAKAKREAEEEKARLEREKKDAQEALIRAEQEKKEAAERAEKERQEAIERAEREKQQAIEAEQARAKAEAERKERECIEKEIAEQKEVERKAANKRHQAKINNECLSDLEQNGIETETAKELIRLVATGQISHMRIYY